MELNNPLNGSETGDLECSVSARGRDAGNEMPLPSASDRNSLALFVIPRSPHYALDTVAGSLRQFQRRKKPRARFALADSGEGPSLLSVRNVLLGVARSDVREREIDEMQCAVCGLAKPESNA